MKKIYFSLFFGLVVLSNAYSINNNTISHKSNNEIIKKNVVIRDKCDIIYDNVYKDVYDHGGTAAEAHAIANAAKCACRSTLTQAPN
ncbi:MAG TPA: hypothetical protein PLP39_07790 [Flavobacterium lutivivi]|nr:hypothetical protein [Flavobacterium lutivivi]